MNKTRNEELTKYFNDTAGSDCVLHFNNAGASLPPDIVVENVVYYLKDETLNGG
ncbi:hypothetical protein ACXZ1K_01020 [Pedobacter sp. PWIIR3]